MSAEDRDHEFVLLAQLIRTQGRHGELIADILTDFPEKFAERKRVWLLPPDVKAASREAEIERHWLHKNRIVLKFAGIDSISEATPLAGYRVAILREQRAPLADDEVYVADLVGCHLIDEAGEPVDLGPVLDVERGTGDALDMLVLKRGEEELLVPFAKAYLVSLDLDARVLRMRLPAGLTAINEPMTDEERAAQRQMSEEDREAEGRGGRQ
ncbi:MAG: ribosome maturation factor RimM [Acidobacteriaceae bacterium]